LLLGFPTKYHLLKKGGKEMFNRTAEIIANQGERLMKLEGKNYNLNRRCLILQGQVDDSIDERINDLKTIASHLTRNDYGNPRAKIAIALEYIEDKIKELDNAENIG
jgi:hypothetical protein